MKIAIMQPTYIPWLGYFSMIDKVDIFVFLDDVQIVQRSWQVRNKIKKNDKELILTIPIDKSDKKKREYRLINNTKYNESIDWKRKHLTSIKQSYSKSTYFEEVYPFLEEMYCKEYDSIGAFNTKIITKICEKIGIQTKLILSSKLEKEDVKKDKLLANICEILGGNYYLSAQGSAVYIEKNNPGGEFSKRGINLYYHNYKHPVYRQLGKKFILNLGIYDLLFNEGFRGALEIIRSGNQEEINYLVFRKEYMKLGNELR